MRFGQIVLVLFGTVLTVLLGVLVNYLTHDYADPEGKRRKWVLVGVAVLVVLTTTVALLQQSATTTEATAGPSERPPQQQVAASVPEANRVDAAKPGTPQPAERQADPARAVPTTSGNRVALEQSHAPQLSEQRPAVWVTDRQAVLPQTYSPQAPQTQAAVPLQDMAVERKSSDQLRIVQAAVPVTGQREPPAQRPASIQPASSRPAEEDAASKRSSRTTVSISISGCEGSATKVDLVVENSSDESKVSVKTEVVFEKDQCGSVNSVKRKLQGNVNAGRSLESSKPLDKTAARAQRASAQADADFAATYARIARNESNEYTLLFIEAVLHDDAGHFLARDYVVGLIKAADERRP